ATVVASLALLFLFAIGQTSALGTEGHVSARPWAVRYGGAILAAGAAFALRTALTPLIGPIELAFSIDLVAIMLAAWFGGLLPGALCLLLSGVASAYYFTEPMGSFLVRNRNDQISFLIFVILGIGIAALADSQRAAVERAVQAESSERQERQRFQTTLTSIGDAVIATDAEGRVTFANRIALSLLRAPEGEVSGKPLADVFRLANHTILIARDGTEVPIDDSAAPIRLGSGSIQGTVLVFRDISERRRAEATGRLLASIVESSDDSILSKDLNGIVTSWNKGAERMFGYSAEEIIGRPVSLLAPSDRHDEMPAILERIRNGEHVDHFQTMRRTKSGKLIHASITVSPVHDAAGRITGASKIIRDITAQIEAQAEVAENRERLRVTLQSIGDGVVTTDTTGCVSYLNPVA